MKKIALLILFILFAIAYFVVRYLEGLESKMETE